MSLYQSYRPKNFSDVVGQDFVKKILSNSCKTQTFHHGYIFFGFHGIGKTTLARIFAEAVNCTSITPEGNPCHTCANCMAYDSGRMIDVIEIDAASYTGVDNIREVIDHAKFTPTQGKFKVYIIDEVHMLSKGAFNALLKTLEEPPAHAIFLLATTEIHKVPDTILSRVIRFDLTKIGEKDMYDLLIKICKQESIHFEENALKTIVHRSRGSIRDSLTMLEKCIINKSVTEKDVEGALHLVNANFLKRTFDACMHGEAEEINNVIHVLESEAIDVREFSTQMTEWIVEHISDAFEQNTFSTYKEIFDLFTRIFVQSKQISIPMDILRMSLYGQIKHGVLSKSSGKTTLTKEEKLPPTVQEIEEELSNPSDTNDTEQDNALETQTQENTTFTPETFLSRLQEAGIKSTMIPLLKTATIRLVGDTLEIQTTGFCQSKCAESNIRQVIETVAKSFNADKINIMVNTSASIENAETQESAEDMARALFG